MRDPAGRDTAHLSELQIEVVNLCNYRCPLCRTLDEDGVARRRMGLGEFQSVLGPVAAGLSTVALYGTRGEPFLNPELEAMVAWLKSASPARIRISTNGSLVDEARCEALLDAAPDEVVFAVDGFSEESYRRYRVGGRLARVLGNLERLARRKRERGLDRPRIVLQTLPMRGNEAELAGIPELAARLGVDEARLKVSASIMRSRRFRPLDLAYAPRQTTGEPFRCPSGLDKLYVDPSGDCFPCCYGEGHAAMRLGNALETPLPELFRSPLAERIRKAFREQRDFPRFCVDSCRQASAKRRIRVWPLSV